jgi:hypothetical protein
MGKFGEGEKIKGKKVKTERCPGKGEMQKAKDERLIDEW